MKMSAKNRGTFWTWVKSTCYYHAWSISRDAGCVAPLRDDFSRIVKISRSRSIYDDLSYSLLNSIVVNVTISMERRGASCFSDLCQRRKQTEDWDARKSASTALRETDEGEFARRRTIAYNCDMRLPIHLHTKIFMMRWSMVSMLNFYPGTVTWGEWYLHRYSSQFPHPRKKIRLSHNSFLHWWRIEMKGTGYTFDTLLSFDII
jgi:hypothetical protein